MGDTACDLRIFVHILSAKKLWGTLLAVFDFGSLSTKTHGDTACDLSMSSKFRNKTKGDNACDM